MPKGQKGRSGEIARSIYQLKLTLIDSQPPIWRRVQVESDATLDRLHDVLQIVMGWTNSHMHGFRVPQRTQPGSRRSGTTGECRMRPQNRATATDT